MMMEALQVFLLLMLTGGILSSKELREFKTDSYSVFSRVWLINHTADLQYMYIV